MNKDESWTNFIEGIKEAEEFPNINNSKLHLKEVDI
jgi:hypothetical protein